MKTLSEIKPDTKGQILYDATYMRYLKKSDSQRQKVEWWTPGAGGGDGGECLIETELWFRKMRKFWRRDDCTT